MAKAKKPQWGKSVQKLGQMVPTDFGNGLHGYSVYLWGREGSMVATLCLIEKPDGTYRLRLDAPTWIKGGLEELGFKLAQRKPRKSKFTTAEPQFRNISKERFDELCNEPAKPQTAAQRKRLDVILSGSASKRTRESADALAGPKTAQTPRLRVVG